MGGQPQIEARARLDSDKAHPQTGGDSQKWGNAVLSGSWVRERDFATSIKIHSYTEKVLDLGQGGDLRGR